jgi:hypothetical protein
MAHERAGTLVLVNSPQNSKYPNLPETDLLADPIYRGVIRRFDKVLGIGDNQSLAESNQFASVVNSVATHSTFVHNLRQKLEPGRITEGEEKLKLRYVGHSVGEMASLIEAGVSDIDTIAKILRERQRITEQPLASRFRYMFAMVGIDLDRLDKELTPIKEAFGDTIKAALANRNTPSQGVLSVESAEGDGKSLARKFTEILKDFKHPLSEKGPRVIHIEQIKNAFHSFILYQEELIFQPEIDKRITGRNFRVPKPKVIYSPMLPGWIETRQQALFVLRHQLTRPVEFESGMMELLDIPDLVGFVTTDAKDTVTPQMVRDNVKGKAPVLNIFDLNSLKNTVDQSVDLLLTA